jgi:hypothetical protein
MALPATAPELQLVCLDTRDAKIKGMVILPIYSAGPGGVYNSHEIVTRLSHGIPRCCSYHRTKIL